MLADEDVYDVDHEARRPSLIYFCFRSILNNFKQHFNTILENKPANPPDFDVYEAMIASKAAEANKAIENTAGASAQQKQTAKNEVGFTSHILIMACNTIHLQDNTRFVQV